MCDNSNNIKRYYRHHSYRFKVCGSTCMLLVALLLHFAVLQSHAIRLNMNINQNKLNDEELNLTKAPEKKIGTTKPPQTKTETKPPKTKTKTIEPPETKTKTIEPPVEEKEQTEEEKLWHGVNPDLKATRSKNWPTGKCPCLPKTGRVWPPPGFDDKGNPIIITTLMPSTTGTKKKESKVFPLVPVIGAAAGGGAALILTSLGIWLMVKRRQKVIPIEEIQPLWSGPLDQFDEAEEGTDDQRATFVQLEEGYA